MSVTLWLMVVDFLIIYLSILASGNTTGDIQPENKLWHCMMLKHCAPVYDISHR